MWNYLKNYSKSTRKLTRENFFKLADNFITAIYRRFKWKRLHEEEQYAYRIVKAQPECLQNKECPCYCPVPLKFWEEVECEEGCYPEFMDKETWNQYKIDNMVPMEDIMGAAKELIKIYNL